MTVRIEDCKNRIAVQLFRTTKTRKKERTSVLSFFCGSPCCPNGPVCESRIGAQVCEANLMRAGSA